jgi:hypothetical protein
MNPHDRLGGIIHTYQKFDPVNFPSPTAPPPDMVSPAFEHLLFYGDSLELTEEGLALCASEDIAIAEACEDYARNQVNWVMEAILQIGRSFRRQ